MHDLRIVTWMVSFQTLQQTQGAEGYPNWNSAGRSGGQEEGGTSSLLTGWRCRV